ncbi:NUDIX domain-containing protein [Streptomyces sp. DW26H14]|uniref:NUDIX domain-containing protein n=1 Tax=Streptomyces sp. DW26H14 TaxID=3435395 RepID=UPI00403D92A9
MGRTEYYHDLAAPKANALVPASNLLVTDETGAILLQRRRDTGQWALTGGAQDIGETAAECAVRECEEETGIVAKVTGFSGCLHQPAPHRGLHRRRDPPAVREHVHRASGRRQAHDQRRGRRRPLRAAGRPGPVRHPPEHAPADRGLPGGNLPLPG